MRRSSFLCLLLSAALSITLWADEGPAPATALDGQVRLNQIQVIGSHNSYHVAPDAAVLKLIAARDAHVAESLDYSHRPLLDQFAHEGIRQIELDVFADPHGGLYAKPLAVTLARDVARPQDPAGLLTQPGLKVLHVPDFDFRSTALTLVVALRQVRDWSRANPLHCPILILIEAKQEAVDKALTQPLPFSPAELEGIDAEILSVFDRGEIITPDGVRGDSNSLREAVVSKGWPTLSESRGKVLFALDNEGEIRDAYLAGHPSLRGRLLFVSVPEDHPAAAFRKLNDPIGEFESIQRAVRQGLLVRTRADSDTRQSRANDAAMREKAFASGAQFVSTDYAEPDRRFSEYCVQFPGGQVARGNPVSGSAANVEREFDAAALRPAPNGKP